MNEDVTSESSEVMTNKTVTRPTVPNYQSDGQEVDIQKAPANIDTTMGKMTSLFEKLVAEKADMPSQGKRPTGRKRQSAELDHVSDYDSDTSSFRLRGKRQRRDLSPDVMSVEIDETDDEVALLLGGNNTSGSKDPQIASEAQDVLDKLAKGFLDDEDIPGPKIEQ